MSEERMTLRRYLNRFRSWIFMLSAGSHFWQDVLIRVLWPRNWMTQRKRDKAHRARFDAYFKSIGAVKVNGKWRKKENT